MDNKSSAAVKIRPFDLSPYRSTDISAVNLNKSECHTAAKKGQSGGVLESGIREVRIQIQSGYQMVLNKKDRVEQFYDTGKEHTKFISHYLKEPSNSLPRAGAILIGAASGYIIGLRHGRIRRLLYTTIGGSAVASFCYPKEAEKVAQQSLTEAKKLAKIGYNFAYGVKPGEIEQFPKLPSTVTDFYASFTGVIKSTMNMFKSSDDKSK